MNYLLDTNVISELSKGQQNEKVQNWFAEKSANELIVSVVTVGEIRNSIERLNDAKRQDRFNRWFSDILDTWFSESIVDIDSAVMVVWAQMRAENRSLPVLDSLIAASALASGSVLVTRNTSDFENINGLKIENPFA